MILKSFKMKLHNVFITVLISSIGVSLARRDHVQIPIYDTHHHESIGWPNYETEALRLSKQAGEDLIKAAQNQDPNLVRKILEVNVALKLNTNKAKNVILFVTEDQPLSAFKTTRDYKQCEGDEQYHRKESFFRYYFRDHAFAKSECYDDVEPDLACAGSAIFTGVKTNKGTIAVDHNIEFGDFHGHPHYENHLESIAHWAQEAGKRTGLVTTAFLTSPSVSPLYAHSSNYEWQSDYDMKEDDVYVRNADIAAQLVEGPTGSRLNVIMGGGGKKFLPFPRGERRDRRNLAKEWLRSKREQGSEHAFVDNRDSLADVCLHTEYLWGLFSQDYMNGRDDPTLAEMTAAAIRLLDKPDDAGFVLIIYASKIYPYDDYTDTERSVRQHVDCFETLKVALKMTDPADTLIIGTTDHHFRSVEPIEEDIEEVDVVIEVEPRQNGRHHGYTREHVTIYPSDWTQTAFGIRVTALINKDNQCDKDAEFCDIRDNGGDSLVFATGPFSHLFSGYMQQNYIAHFIGYAACIGNSLQMCDDI